MALICIRYENCSANNVYWNWKKKKIKVISESNFQTVLDRLADQTGLKIDCEQSLRMLLGT